MGSSLSPILAEIYINDFENHIINNSKYNNIKMWSRYDDDIPILWKGTNRQLNQFVTETKNVNKDIQFTVEKCNKTINYQD